jgi:hypothetical protein
LTPDADEKGLRATAMSGEVFKDRDAGWRKLLELRSQREIVQHWLHSAGVPEQLQEQLRIMLDDIELELHGLEMARRPGNTTRMREAS